MGIFGRKTTSNTSLLFKNELASFESNCWHSGPASGENKSCQPPFNPGHDLSASQKKDAENQIIIVVDGTSTHGKPQ